MPGSFDKKLLALPLADPLSGSEPFYCVQDGLDKQTNPIQIRNFIGVGITDGDKGDIVVSGGGAVWTLDTIIPNPHTFTGQIQFKHSLLALPTEAFGGGRLVNSFQVIDNGIDASGLSVPMLFGSVNSLVFGNGFGRRMAGYDYIANFAPSDPANTTHDIIARSSTAESFVGDGGTNTGAGAKGNYFGASPAVHLGAGALNVAQACAQEVDVFLETGASVRDVFGSNVQWTNEINAARFEFAYGTGSATGYTAKAKFGFGFHDLGGEASVGANSTLFGAEWITIGPPTVLNGIDLSLFGISNYAWQGPGFTSLIDGLGNALFLNLTISSLTAGFLVTNGSGVVSAATTSAALASVISDETGSGALVFAASPTLSGVPLAPTAAPGTNTTQIATTAFVTAAGGSFQPLDADLTALAGNSTDGFWAHTGAGTGAARTLTAPAAGLTISNPAGIAGNPTFALANDLSALESLSSTGIAVRSASDTWVQRTVTGTAAQITVTNGDGVSGNPTLSLPADVLIPTVLTVPNTGLHLLDTDASHDLILKPGSNITADRTLTITTGDADRTLTISASATVSQDYSTAGNPQFATIELGAVSDTTLARVSPGVVSIEGVTILTTATGQPLDATLTALAAYNTNGLLTQTGADAFAGRTITGTAAQITVTDGNGVAGNPTLSFPADVLIPTVLTVPNTGLHLLDTNASHDLIIKPGSNITADRTLTVTTGDTDIILNLTATTDEFILAYDTSTNTWRGVAPGAGSGDFVGPASSTDNAVVRFDGTTGKLGQNSAVFINDTTGHMQIGDPSDPAASLLTAHGDGNLYGGVTQISWSTSIWGLGFFGAKSRSATIGTYTIVQNNDILSYYTAQGSDGSVFREGATIYFYVDGTPALGQVPGRIVFQTRDDASGALGERAVVKNDGKFGIGTMTPDRLFHVEQDTATTNAVTYVERLTSTSSGTPAVGIGVGIEFEIETSAANPEVGATIEAAVQLGTGAAEIITLNAKQMAAGALQEALGLTFLSKVITANVAYSNVNTVQPWFPSGGAVSLEGSTTYEFEGQMLQTNGTTSHTVGISFTGTATLTSIAYVADFSPTLVNATITTANITQVNQAANTVVTPAITTAGTAIRVRGIVRVNGAGTFIPNFTFSAAPGAGNILANTFFKLRKWGSNTVVNQGNWA